MKAAVGAEFSFKMKPSGEIENIKIPEATLKKLREGLPDEQGEQEAFSEQALKDMVTQSSPPAFPRGPARTRQELVQQAEPDVRCRWERSFSIDRSPSRAPIPRTRS